MQVVILVGLIVFCVLCACVAYFLKVVDQTIRRRATNRNNELLSLPEIFRTLFNSWRNAGRGPNIAGTRHYDDGRSNVGGYAENINQSRISKLFGLWFSAKKSEVTCLTKDFIVGNEVVILVKVCQHFLTLKVMNFLLNVLLMLFDLIEIRSPCIWFVLEYLFLC